MSEALTFRQRLTWLAHLFKAITRRYHREAAHFLRPLLPADAVVFDVGAHAGQFCKLFAELAPQGRIYAFEPSPYALSILRPMLFLHRLRHVTVIKAGLSDQPGQETLNIPIKKRGSVGFGLAHLGEETTGRSVKSYPIHLTTIDTVATEQRLSRLDFIKADIEGWEWHMLQGGAQTLARFRPALLVEINDASLARAGKTSADMFNFFTPLNYTAYFTDEHAGYTLQPVDSYEKPGDYLLVPSEKATRLLAA